MKKLCSVCLYAALLLLGCNSSSEQQDNLPPDLSANENNGLREIISYYGGSVHFEKGSLKSSVDGSSKNIFEVTISNSKTIENNREIANFPASNTAWLLYKNLGSEKSNLDEIHSIFIYNDGQKVTTKIPTADLEIVAKKMKLLQKLVALIKKRRYGDLRPYINNTDLVAYDKDTVINQLIAYDADFGTVERFVPFGFRKNKTTDGRSILHLSGHIIRSKKNNEFSIDVDMNSDIEEVLLIQYAL